MKTTGFVFLLLAANDLTMSDEQIDTSPQTESSSDVGVPTLGGRQFWGDIQFSNGWRIQHNVLTDRYRLLDEKDSRHASGTVEDCRAKLELVQSKKGLQPPSGKAVILIHGIGRSSKSFSSMAKQLAGDDYTVVSFDYPSTRIPIPDSAEYLRKVIQSLEGHSSIDIVAHSMGGLVLRAYIMRYPETQFRRAVMLGVPNKGAQMADFLKKNPIFKAILGPAGQQLATDTNGLIARLPTPQCEFGVLAGGRSATRGYNPLLAGDNDSTVTVASTRLAGAADFILLPVIHSFLMSDKRAVAATKCFLKNGRFQSDRRPEPISKDDVTVLK